MNIKEMIKNKLGPNHIYCIDDHDFTSTVLGKMTSIVQDIMLTKNITFDEAFLEFFQSDLFAEIDDITTNVWSEEVSELIRRYYSYTEGKTK